MKWRSYTERAGDLFLYGSVCDDQGKGVEGCVKVGGQGDVLWVKCEGVESKEDALCWVGRKLYVVRELFPVLEEGEWYCHDLVGLKVVDNGGVELGEVVAVEDYGAGPILAWRRLDGSEELYPYSDDFFGCVDLEAGRIVFEGVEV
jgi:16S rRNA processing protein RimM